MPYTKRTPHYNNAKDLLEYICNDEKTENGLYVSAQNCFVETASVEFENNYNKWQTKGNRVAYHLIQSFHPNDPITPEIANKIGVRLCKELYPDFQCVISTHVDKGHIHNHIAINAVDVNGKKLEDRLANKKEGLYGFREMSDKISAEYGCFILPSQTISIKGKKDYYYQYQNQTWQQHIKEDIDELKENCFSINELFLKLIESGYEIKNGKQPAIKGKGMKKFKRFNSLGNGYTICDLKAFYGDKNYLPDDIPNIKANRNAFNDVAFNAGVESRQAILTTSKLVTKQYTTFQKTRYQEIKRYYEIKNKLELLNSYNINSFDELTLKIEDLRGEVLNKNHELYKLKKKHKSVLNDADKAQDFIHLKKIADYANYYKEIDNDFSIKKTNNTDAFVVPDEVRVFEEIRNELQITTEAEAKKIVETVRPIRLEINKLNSEIINLQSEMNKLDMIKENGLVESGLFIHNIKFGANRIDYSNSNKGKWCVNLPYTNEYILIEKSQVTFNSKNEFYTLFLIDDKEYAIYSEKEIKKNSNKKPWEKEDLIPTAFVTGSDLEKIVENKKDEYTQMYKNNKYI